MQSPFSAISRGKMLMKKRSGIGISYTMATVNKLDLNTYALLYKDKYLEVIKEISYWNRKF